MELIRLSYPTFRDLERDLSPRLGLDGGWLPAECSAQPGDEVEFEVGVRDGFPVLRGRGEVVAAGGGDEIGVAVRFSDLERGSRVLLQRLVSRHEATGGSRVVLPLKADPGRSRRSAEVREVSPEEPPPFPQEHEAGPLLVKELENLLDREAGNPLHATQVVRPPDEEEEEPQGEADDREDEMDRYGEAGRPRWRRRGAKLVAVLAVAVLAGVWWWAGRNGDPGVDREAPSSDASPTGPAEQAATDGGPAEASAAIEALNTIQPPAADAQVEGTVDAPAEQSVAAASPFARVVDIEAEERGDATVLTVRLDGAVDEGRLATERVDGGRPRLLLRLRGVSDLPSPAVRELDVDRLARVRMGRHDEGGGPSLWLVTDLAGSEVRLERIDLLDGALELLFVSN